MITPKSIGIYWLDCFGLPWIDTEQQEKHELYRRVCDMAKQLIDGIQNQATTWTQTEHGWENEDRLEFDLAMTALVGFLVCNRFVDAHQKDSAPVMGKPSFSRVVRIPVNSALFEGREKELFPALLGLNTIHLVRMPHPQWADDEVVPFEHTHSGKVDVLTQGGNGLWRWAIEEAPDKTSREHMKEQGWSKPFFGRCVVCHFNDDIASVLPFCREYLGDISKYKNWWQEWYTPAVTSHWAQSKACKAVWEHLYGDIEKSEYTYKRGSISAGFKKEIKHTFPTDYSPWEWDKLSAKEIIRSCRTACKMFIDANLALWEHDQMGKDLFLLGVVGFLVYNHHLGSIKGEKSFCRCIRFHLDKFGKRHGYDLSSYIPQSPDEVGCLLKGEGAQLMDLIQYRAQGAQAIFRWGKHAETWNTLWKIEWDDVWECERPANVFIWWNVGFCQLLPFAVDLLGDISEYVKVCEDWYEEGWSAENNPDGGTIYRCIKGAYDETGQCPCC